MGRYIINPRRAPRVSARLRVRVGLAGSEFGAETRDFGPGGCLMVAPRVIPAGAPLRLIIEDDALPELLKIAGGAVWGSRDEHARVYEHARVGVAFLPHQRSDPTAWFRRLLDKNPLVAARLTRVPESLDDRTRVFLLEPPDLGELRPEELALLNGFVDGVTVGELIEDSRERSRERVRAIFALLERRALSLTPRGDPSLAARAIPAAGGARPVELRASPPTLGRSAFPAAAQPEPAGQDARHRPVERPPAAQSELEVGRRLAATGNYAAALAHLRHALLLSPRDPGIAVLIGEYAFKDRRVH
ncbi:MAG TPA: PilZ domain-containing protein [Anaeromyxobacteraceae bacterium]|jgi:hypothetical protein|nr:PilZ domain-containing protein [Anaeromyxobacteraceae bacterium]